MCVRYGGAQRQAKVEIGKFVVTFVVTKPFFQLLSGVFTYETRRGRESNPRVGPLKKGVLHRLSCGGVEMNKALFMVRIHAG